MNLLMLFLFLFSFNPAEKKPQFFFLEGKNLQQLKIIDINTVKTNDIQIFINFHQIPRSVKVDGIKQKIVLISKAQKKQLKIQSAYYKIIWKIGPDMNTSTHKISFLSRSGKVFEEEFTLSMAGNPN